MKIRDVIVKCIEKIKGLDTHSVNHFSLPSVEAKHLAKGAASDLEKLFYNHTGRVCHKWVHYLAIYAKEFSAFRGKPLTFLEIGVSEGGSLELWRKYFGESATIFGIDIMAACQHRVDPPNQVRIGSQDDQVFLNNVLDEMGDPDIVLDDGSHVGRHQFASFQVLFPRLKVGGLYIIEDLQTAYWHGMYEGGYRRKGTGIELAKTLVDDMHGWYHESGQRLADKTEIASVRFYDSTVVIEKGAISMPKSIRVGESPETK